MNEEHGRKMMTAEEVAPVLRVSTPTVCKMARDGRLAGRKVGRQWLFRRADIDAYTEGAQAK
jgi:excisionase family DNA binding protein